MLCMYSLIVYLTIIEKESVIICMTHMYIYVVHTYSLHVHSYSQNSTFSAELV